MSPSSNMKITKVNGTDYPILQSDGSNYLTWANTISESLKGEGHYWLISQDDATEAEKTSYNNFKDKDIKDELFIKSNRVASHLIFHTICPDLQSQIVKQPIALNRWTLTSNIMTKFPNRASLLMVERRPMHASSSILLRAKWESVIFKIN